MDQIDTTDKTEEALRIFQVAGAFEYPGPVDRRSEKYSLCGNNSKPKNGEPILYSCATVGIAAPRNRAANYSPDTKLAVRIKPQK